MLQSFKNLLITIGLAVVALIAKNKLVKEQADTIDAQGKTITDNTATIADLTQQLNDAGATKADLQAAQAAQSAAEQAERDAQAKVDDLESHATEADDAQKQLAEALNDHPNTDSVDPVTLATTEPGDPVVADPAPPAPQTLAPAGQSLAPVTTGDQAAGQSQG